MKIPYSAANDEDQTTPRVCFAESLEGCLSAIGACNRDLHTGCQIVVRSVNECDLNPDKLVPPEWLFADGLVPDALETGEWWYLDKVDVVRNVYTVMDFSYEYDIAFSCIKRNDLAEIMERYVPGQLLKRTESVENAYNRVMRILYRDGRYRDADKFENEIVELPWARCLRIYDLKLSKVVREVSA